MPQTALVILNFNGRSYLEKFLPSVLQHTAAGVEIIVGDNKSTDDSISFLQQNYPGITVIENEENFGFSKGYNEVLKRVKADYYFLLNSDVELSMPWQPLIQAMKNDPLLAALQPKILSYHQRDVFEHAGAAGGWIDILGYPFCRGRILDRFEKDLHQYDYSVEIFWASGAAMMVRAEVFHQLGGFDPDYFAHMEEIDWCWRAKKCGWKIKALPEVTVYHIGGGTLPYNSTRKIFLNFRNNLATIFKNDSLLRLITTFIPRLGLDGVALLSFVFRGEGKSAVAIIKAYLNFLLWIPDLISKRKQISQLAKGKRMNSNGIFNGSLIFSFFILGKKTFKTLVNEQTTN